MQITVEFGWWLLPLAMTLASFSLAAYVHHDNDPGAYGAGSIISVMFYGGALIVSLFFWLVWALVS